MEINVSKLQSEVEKYNLLVKQYEECIRNFYNTLSQTPNFWHDGRATRFDNNVFMEKKDTFEIFENLTAVRDVYNYILDRYGKLGNKIKFDLSYSDSVNSRFNNVILSLEDAIRSYNNLNLWFGPSERGTILREKSKLVSIKNNLSDLKAKVSKVFNELEEIEKEVNRRVSEIKVKYIKENKVDDYI